MGSAQRIAEQFREAGGDLEAMDRLLDEHAADDYVHEWPQSGERIRGRRNMRAINENYGEKTGTDPQLTVNEVSGGEDVIVVESTVDYGDGTPVRAISIGRVEDGRITRVREYFAYPFEAPEWRRDLVERMDEPATV